MKRNSWSDVYKAQDALLNILGKRDDLIFGGGTAIQRSILPQQMRESEDLDFFFEKPCRKPNLPTIGREVVSTVKDTGAEILNIIDSSKECGSFRIFCVIPGNEEIIKIELLDFTADRFGPKNFYETPRLPFKRTENPYNLLLYKFKALCDRPDSYKDIFDLNFLFREVLPPIDTRELFQDLQLKFKETTHVNYDINLVLKSLKAARKWDLVMKNTYGVDDSIVKEAIDMFATELETAITEPDKDLISLSYLDYTASTASKVDINSVSLEEFCEYFNTNNFLSEAMKDYYARKNILNKHIKDLEGAQAGVGLR